MRADKWLWAVRVFKTRTQAGAACRGNLVKVEGQPIKPSRELREGDVLQIEKEVAVRKCRVIDFPPRRISAREADAFREDLTPPPARKGPLDFLDFPSPRRDKGQGRPTKRERRELDRWLETPGDGENPPP